MGTQHINDYVRDLEGKRRRRLGGRRGERMYANVNNTVQEALVNLQWLHYIIIWLQIQ